MIKPTLFIGLGTTGLKILKSLRQLMFEEYGQEGLPIFRYVSIETDGGIDGTDDSLIDEIQVVRATILDTAPILDKLNPLQPVYNEHLEKWLDSGLLKFVAAFTEGAANIRMAGRLCLWENWDTVDTTLTSAQIAISAPDTMTKAVSILTDHYKSKGQPVPAGGPIDVMGVNVYIVGSLCGGSCSGMLIDVAYFCRHLIGDDATKKVYGIFTMFDEGLAAGADEAISVRAANCFAALWELNYYKHINTTYNVTFPSGHSVNTTNKPFDDAKFVSPSGKGGIFAKDGKFDEDGLNLMVALNLFADTAGDTDGTKAAILADGVGFPGIGGVKDVLKGEIAVMVRAMASFGLTAVWYPKYRIASAAAYSISKNLCGSWLETHVDEAVVEDQAKKAWTTILDENINVLTSPKGQLALKTRIDNELGKVEAAFDLINSTDHLKKRIENFPPGPGGPFKSRFAPGGDYHDLISMQVPVCQNEFRNSIEQVFNTQLSKIDFKGTYGLGDVQAFFLKLDKEIEKYIEMLSIGLPSLDLSQLNYDLMRSAEKNNWTKLIFLHNQSVKDEREKLIANFRKLIFEDKNRESIYQSVRNHFLRPVLQEARAQLGFGVPGIDGETVKQKLDRIEANLKSCVKKFNESYEIAIDKPDATAIKIVTNNPLNSVDEDANALSLKIFKADTDTELLKGSSMAAFLVKDPQDIMNQMIETYRRLSLEQIPVKNVVEQVTNILDVGGPEGIEIKNLANRSDSYQNFIPGHVGFKFAPPLKIISGHDPTADDHVLAALQKQFVDPAGIIKFPRIGSSSVDHLLFFYQAESGFALDDLASYKMLKMQFDKCPGPYGHLTHRNPNFYDLQLHHKNNRLNRWCQVLSRLVPEICNRINDKAFAGVFRLDYGRYVFEYHIDMQLQTLSLNDDPDGIKRLSRIENSNAYENFIRSVQSKFMELDRQQITEKIVDSLLREVEDLNLRNELSDYYDQFLDEVYSLDDSIDNTNSDGKLEAHFSQTIPQTHQETPTEEPDETPSNPYQQVDSESDLNATADTEDYTEVAFEEEDVELTTVQETQVNFGDTPQQDDATDEDDEGFATVETEPSPTDESDEEATPEQQPQPEVAPETGEQKQQTQPAKEFSVADVKPLQRRDNTRKKE